MYYFKNKNNEIFAYDDAQIKQGYGKDLTPITEKEKDELLAPTAEELAQQELEQKRAKALKYLADTDFYYPRYLETGEPVPTDVVIKRQENRIFLRENENVR